MRSHEMAGESASTRAHTIVGRIGSVLAAVLLLGAATGCNSPTAPQSEDMLASAANVTLGGAQVVVEGQIVNGQTIPSGQMHGGSTLFRATLTGPHGPALGLTVQVRYRVPGSGPGNGPMGPREGYLHLHDDGTHGDPIAGDGIYCYEDRDGPYGPHWPDAPQGQYHYEFFGFDAQQRHCNHVSVFVNVTPD